MAGAAALKVMLCNDPMASLPVAPFPGTVAFGPGVHTRVIPMLRIDLLELHLGSVRVLLCSETDKSLHWTIK